MINPAPRELIVVVKPEAKLRLTHKNFISLEANVDVSPLNKLLSPEVVLKPLFGQSEDRLRRKTQKLEKERNVKLPDLSLYYRLFAPDDQLYSWAHRLKQDPLVESAFVKPAPELPGGITSSGLTANPNTDDLIKYQEYLEPERGIDARFAWDQNGGEGEDVTIVDVERSWRFTHEDIKHNPGSVMGIPAMDLPSRDHGTAVMGMLKGIPNKIGITGICPAATVIAAVAGEKPQGAGTADVIRAAADTLELGDIILIELHYPGPLSSYYPSGDTFGYIPAEWWPDNLKAIQYATQCGVLVVEAGGNGRVSLDDTVYDNPTNPPGPFPRDWENPFKRKGIDSKAIVVGGGAPPRGTHRVTTEPDCCRLPHSNFGSMFDAQGWGSNVATCGYGKFSNGAGANEDRWYTLEFSGTSSAAAMVAGALACVQGVRKAKGVAPLTPLQARDLLRKTGALQQPSSTAPVSERIGNRPNLKQMIEEMP